MSAEVADNEFRDKMCIRFLKEVCGRTDEISEEDIRSLDHIPYIILIRPLVVLDSVSVSMEMLGNRFNIKKRQVAYIISNEYKRKT